MGRDGKGVGFSCKNDVFDGQLNPSSLFYVHSFPSVPLLASFGFSFTDKGRKKFVVSRAGQPPALKYPVALPSKHGELTHDFQNLEFPFTSKSVTELQSLSFNHYYYIMFIMTVRETIEKSEEEDEKNKSSINQSILDFKNTVKIHQVLSIPQITEK